MTEMENQLRMLMRVATSEPPGRVNVQDIRHRVRLRRAVECAAAAAVVVLAAGAGAIASAGSTGVGPAGGSHPAAREPPYYIQQDFRAARRLPVVPSTATGAVTANGHMSRHGSRVPIPSFGP